MAVDTMGIGLDYGGFGFESISLADIAEILVAFPRLEMKQRFFRGLPTSRHSEETSYDNFLRDFGKRFKTISAVDLLMNAPFGERVPSTHPRDARIIGG